MSVKRAVTFQKDASGDTDHGERSKILKTSKVREDLLLRIPKNKTWKNTFHFLASSYSISNLTFEPFDIFQQIDCPRTFLWETQLFWKFERIGEIFQKSCCQFSMDTIKLGSITLSHRQEYPWFHLSNRVKFRHNRLNPMGFTWHI